MSELLHITACLTFVTKRTVLASKFFAGVFLFQFFLLAQLRFLIRFRMSGVCTCESICSLSSVQVWVEWRIYEMLVGSVQTLIWNYWVITTIICSFVFFGSYRLHLDVLRPCRFEDGWSVLESCVCPVSMEGPKLFLIPRKFTVLTNLIKDVICVDRWVMVL